MTDDSPYHAGELAVQVRASETGQALRNGRAISNHISGGAVSFIQQQAMVTIGSMDCQGQVWASVIFGQPGFIRATDERTLDLDLVQAGVSADDPLWSNLNTNTSVGLLLIDLGSRRRFRVNGKIHEIDTQHYVINVEQAYPNCPKYIQRRHLKKTNIHINQHHGATRYGTGLNSNQQTRIANADTFFVASAHPDHGLDASHRGGQPGFVDVLNNTLLRIPDYIGNNMFNTLGNFHCYPHAGLVFIDFQKNRLLQLTGKVEILWPPDDPNEETKATQRYWQFEIIAWRESHIPFDISWEFLDYSPFNPEQYDPPMM